MTQINVQKNIETALEQIGVYASVNVEAQCVTLAGEVDTEEARQAAEDVILGILPNVRIENELEVQDTLPVDVEGFQAESGPADNLSESRDELMPAIARSSQALRTSHSSLPPRMTPATRMKATLRRPIP